MYAAGAIPGGLLALLAELFLAGVIDKGGNFNTALNSPRIRTGEHGYEYVVAWGSETDHGRDIVFTRIDIDNLLRAKAAIYAGFTVMADSVGVALDSVEQVLIGGSFGKYINVEKAVQIGLLPDMPWNRFQFLGNTAVKGAYYALLDRDATLIDVVRDQSDYVVAAVDAVKEHLVLGALFASLVVLLFLGSFRSAVVAALAIPVSIIGTFALMWWQGFTLNMITLLALALAVGIVIDDAIVVLENIHRFVEEKGMKPFPAVIAATKDKAGLVIPVVITVYQDKSFTFITKSPPASVLLKKAAGIASGSKARS